MNKQMTNIETKRTKREELIYLYTLESAKVNLELASNPNCLDLLKAIAKIKDEYINVKLAGNPNCPQNILEELSEEVIRKKEYNNRPYFEISDYEEPTYNDFER